MFESAWTADDRGALLAALTLAGDVELLAAADVAATKPARAPRLPISLRASVPHQARPRKLAGRAPPSVDARRDAAKMVGRLRFSRRTVVKVSTPPALAPKTPHEARLLAEQAFQAGRGLLRANLLDRAVPLLRRAAELYPEALEYRLYADWVAHRLPENVGAPTPAALKVLAEKAVRRDPNFAFGHYVLGHLARLEGDPVAADALFAHASRLDPGLAERERHVRIVARQPPPVPGRAPRPASNISPEPPPVTPAALAAPERPAAVPEPRPRPVQTSAFRTSTKVTLALLAASLVVGMVVWWPSSPQAKPLGASSASPVERAATPATPPPTASFAPLPSDAPPASAPSVPAAAASSAPQTLGDVTTPSGAAGHRVFFDGRVLGDAPATFHVTCGRHTSQIGSAGKPQPIDVPCGGAMTLPE